MEVDQNIESEVLKVYDTWLHSYLNGDVTTYDSFFDDEYHFIGSTNNEEFLNRKTTTKFFKDTAEQLAGKCDLRNETRTLEQFGELIFITHFFDAWFLNGKEYNYYGRFRFTNALRKNKEGWRFIYQHFSTPDSKTDEGETIGFDKVNAENLELKEAIKRRTVELENKNRELEIEAALERIRARTMAMQKSEELADVAFVLFEQLRVLGGNLWGTGFGLCEKDSDKDSFWFANENGVFPPVSIPNTTDPTHTQMFEGWKAGKEFLAIEASNKDLKSHYDYMLSLPEVKSFFQKILDEGLSFPEWQQWNAAYFKHGYLLIITLEPYPDPDILERFAHVFEQTYTRFLDLQKAEAQAREAQVEAALERVRSRSLAMHTTDELQEVVQVVAEQLKNTGVILDVGGAVICTYFQDSKDVIHWTATEDPLHPSVPYLLPYFKDELFDEAWSSKNSGDDYFAKEFSYDVKNAFFNYAFEHSDYRQLPHEYKKIILDSKSHGIAWAWSENSAIMIPSIQGDLPSEEERKILIRFAKVFEQSFIRFLDLKKAEAQAREAQIENALEKVRSRSLAMHKSDELNEVVKVLFEKMTELEVPSTAVGIQTFREGSKDMQCFVCGDVGTGMVVSQYLLPYFDHPVMNEYNDVIEKDLDYYVGTYSKEEKESFYDVVLKLPELNDLPAEVNTMIRESSFYEVTMVPAEKSVMSVNDFHGNPLSKSQIDILKRFAKVFDQAYIRFLDLQNVEEKAREAQVNLAVERVRARALAMFESEEILQVANTLRNEFMGLNIPNVTAATIHLREPDGKYRVWDLTSIVEEGNELEISLDFSYRIEDTHPDFFMREVWEKKEDYYVVIQGIDRTRHTVQWLRDNGYNEYANGFEEFLESSPIEAAYHPTVPLSNGRMSIDMLEPPHSEVEPILKKMAGAFDLAYKRFEDLKNSEKQVREAKIEASLERVRAKAMSMQNSDELDEVLFVLCEQFDVLEILPMSTHLTVFNFENNTFTFRETGKYGDRSFGEQTVDLDAMDTWKDTVDKWKADKATDVNKLHFPKETLPEVWDVFHESFASMPEESRITPDDYPDGIYHTAGKHSFGYIGMNQIRPATQEEEEMVIKFANEFGRAYQRFLDLQKAEEQARMIRDERDRLEIALKQLEATKDQLVQQEKLASLGQLTAGIAHEIKNPLNFVNNFSDLSVELIEEVREELRNQESEISSQKSPFEGGAGAQAEVGDVNEDGRTIDIDYTLSILNDIEANLRKIHEHGSRADSIVKSMLQHSRGGDGKMEPENLNALVKEFVNLAFHGMRAGKEPINVDMQFDLDDSIYEVPLIAEDFSRVIVNLCNNAFDAMKYKLSAVSDQPSASPFEGGKSGEAVKGGGLADVYLPQLTVKTFRESNQVIVQIADNGPGIPEEIRDKIMQPFFTTKKGTEGTGLGLSITNDIVKAHGGDLKVVTNEGKGSRFSIELPLT